jgi:3-hydroxybutyryl-CoA dehydratase
MTRSPHWSDLIKIGDTSPELRHSVTFEAIQTFAQLTGDFEPVHVDRAYARRMSHADCLAHGVMVLGLMSDRLLAEDRVGPNVSYGYDRVRFIRPIVAGSMVTTQGRIVEIRSDRQQVCVEETCRSAEGELLAVANHVFRFV